MRISDWSSDVGSSDLHQVEADKVIRPAERAVENVTQHHIGGRDDHYEEHDDRRKDSRRIFQPAEPPYHLPHSSPLSCYDRFAAAMIRSAARKWGLSIILSSIFTTPASGPAAKALIICCAQAISASPGETAALRSEAHTSELHSLMRISYAVFCLKKKNIYYT